MGHALLVAENGVYVHPHDLGWGDAAGIALGALLIVLAIFAWRWYRG